VQRHQSSHEEEAAPQPHKVLIYKGVTIPQPPRPNLEHALESRHLAAKPSLISPLKKCSVAEGEEFRLGARKENAGESVDSSSFPDAAPGAKGPPAGRMTSSTGCYGRITPEKSWNFSLTQKCLLPI